MKKKKVKKIYHSQEILVEQLNILSEKKTLEIKSD